MSFVAVYFITVGNLFEAAKEGLTAQRRVSAELVPGESILMSLHIIWSYCMCVHVHVCVCVFMTVECVCFSLIVLQ